MLTYSLLLCEGFFHAIDKNVHFGYTFVMNKFNILILYFYTFI